MRLDPDKYEVMPIGITRTGQWITGGDPMRALTASSPMFHLGEGEMASAKPLDAASTSALVQEAGSSASSSVPSGVTEGVDVVFPALHGPMGEDGTVQGLLELAECPTSGPACLVRPGMDKAMTKTILDQAGLPQVPWRLVNRKDWERRSRGHCTQWIGEQPRLSLLRQAGQHGFQCR